MHPSPLLRTLLASAAIVAALALGGCDPDGEGLAQSARSLKPLSAKMMSEIAEKDMTKDSPILVRLFKQESEFEVWKQDRSGKFALLKTYPICRWSGELGPKVKEGDRQAPEGFYAITPGQMNPNSHYYLAFNTGFPNAYDRALGRTGAELMVHGDCSSRGCYAMTDEQIAEIYSLGRDAFFGGQRSFQLQAYPFRMTPANLALHRNNPNMPFWKMLKEGYDHFEVTRLEPKVDVCDKHYVFDANANGGKFTPAGACPAYQVPEEIASPVRAKEHQDEIQTAELISRGGPVAPIKTGTDGGMHPVFLAALKKGELTDMDGNVRAILPGPGAPGTIPPTVNPPRAPQADTTGSVVATNASPVGAASIASLRSIFSKPAAAPTQVASASPDTPIPVQADSKAAPKREAAASRPPNSVGLRGSGSPAEARKPEPPRPPVAVATARPKAKPGETAKALANNAATAPGAKPQKEASALPQPLLTGAQPMMPTGNFDSRWGGLR